MKHAGQDALSRLGTILDALRARPDLIEKSPGCFYRRSKAFAHFHEDPSGLFADLKESAAGFTRHRVTTRAEQGAFLARVRRHLSVS